MVFENVDMVVDTITTRNIVFRSPIFPRLVSNPFLRCSSLMDTSLLCGNRNKALVAVDQYVQSHTTMDMFFESSSVYSAGMFQPQIEEEKSKLGLETQGDQDLASVAKIRAARDWEGLEDRRTYGPVLKQLYPTVMVGLP